MKSCIALALILSGSAMLAPASDDVRFVAVEETVTVVAPSPRPAPGVMGPMILLAAANIRIPEDRSDLLITPSMVTAINTRTQNDGARANPPAGSNAPSTFAQSSATITVVVRVNGQMARPGPITYDNITRSNSARFGGVVNSCTEVDQNTGQVNCNFTDEQLVSILNEMGARSFNFFQRNVRPGNHRVEVYGAFTFNDAASPSGGTPPGPADNRPFASATTVATIGPRTLTVTAIPRPDNDRDAPSQGNETEHSSLGQSVSALIDRLGP